VGVAVVEDPARVVRTGMSPGVVSVATQRSAAAQAKIDAPQRGRTCRTNREPGRPREARVRPWGRGPLPSMGARSSERHGGRGWLHRQMADHQPSPLSAPAGVPQLFGIWWHGRGHRGWSGCWGVVHGAKQPRHTICGVSGL
jgi:hypothetical protein